MNLTLEQIAGALGGEINGEQVRAPGPGHSIKDRSLVITIDGAAPGGFVVHSFAGDDWKICKDYITEKLGLRVASAGGHQSPFITAEYIYLTEDATPFLRVSRTRDKRFLQSHWNGKKWIKGKPLGPKIPYHLPQLLQAQEVFVVEGEKDADNLKAQGLAATTSPEGAGKWTPDLNKWLERKEVYVLPDNDEVGKKHAHDVARNLNGIAQTVRIVGLPNLPPKGDVSDWIDAGGTADELLTSPARLRLTSRFC